jgi:hypothetical protein
MRPIWLVGRSLLGLVLTACVALPVPSSPPPLAGPMQPSARPTPATVPPPIATPQPATPVPAPTIPDNLSTTATVEQDGVRITIELERNPMPAGQPTRVTSTVTNTGPDPVVYVPCGEAVNVGAAVVGPPWRSGLALPNPAVVWKSYLLTHQGLEGGDRSLFFFAEGQTGAASGCGDVAHVTSLAPGATFRDRARWDGLAFRRLAPPPTARIDLVGRFEFDRGDPLVEHPPEDRHVLEAHLETWIEGLPDAFLDPAEVADIALRDPRLTALLAARDLNNANEGVLIFDPVSATYQVGMLESGNLPVSRAHLLTIDPVTGEIEGWVERDWDYAVDDFP